MGCATSKLQDDDSPPVALCRDRCSLLDHASRCRFTFAQSHAAYLLSLNSLALSLHRFFTHQHELDHLHTGSVTSPPARTKGDHHLHSHSNSGSISGSDSESSLRHYDAQPDHYTPEHQGFMNMNYMKKTTTPSVVHTQRSMIPETMYAAEFSASSSLNNPYPISASDNQEQDPASYTSDNLNVDNYDDHANYGAKVGFRGGSSPQAAYSEDSLSTPVVQLSSTVPPPPPPPPPPRSSTWDFLNPFDTVESYYPTQTQSHDSRDIRIAEGIPDLEDEDDEVVKEIHGDQRLVGGTRSAIRSKPVAPEDVRVTKPSSGMDKKVEYKNADDGQQRLKARAKLASGREPQIMREIQIQFEHASNSGSELAKVLEVGSLPYNGKHSRVQASSKLLHLPVASFLPSLSTWINNVDPSAFGEDEDAELRSRNQSSTLHKLYLWEKKLYEEVKAEEKMRVLHEVKSRKLMHLDRSGAEAPKVDATRSFVRSLSTKIKIAMQVVDKISVKINNLRDEELWPQLHELIQGLIRMWKLMLECHRSQRRALREAKQLDAIAFSKPFGDAHLEATRQLEHDIINWALGFSRWVAAQKDYVRTLNNWLMKCLLYVPEETPDGLAPFSPGRIGAPPVFVVCNEWSKSLDRMSETEVVNSMRDFATNVLLQWDGEKEDQKIKKEIHALENNMLQMISGVYNGNGLYEGQTSGEGGSLQASLLHVFEALEKYADTSVRVYEELLQHMDEEHGDHLTSEHEKVS